MNAGLIRLLLLGGLLIGALWGGAKIVSTVRGIRNNNPGNIRLSNETWVGQVPAEAQTDPSFVQFLDPVYGIRAMARILSSYANRGVVTLRAIVSTWAPPTENDTAAYLASVVGRTGIAPDAPTSRAQWPAIIAALIQQENGQQPYDAATIARGISMA